MWAEKTVAGGWVGLDQTKSAVDRVAVDTSREHSWWAVGNEKALDENKHQELKS
jgi:hypothetical protein